MGNTTHNAKPHKEPDADDYGGKSDEDADNRKSARRMLAEKVVSGWHKGRK